MIFKKKEFFLITFLILMQSCSGGRIGNFLESSFNDLENISQDEDLKENLIKKKNVVKEKKEINVINNKKTKKVEKPKKILEIKKEIKSEKEKKEINVIKNKKTKKVEKPKNVLENNKDDNFEKITKQKNSKINNSSKNRKNELQSYKIILILKDVDPKDPTEKLSSILRNSEVNFELEKIERILDSKNKSMNKN